MKSLSFRKDLVGVQDELLRFAYKLTTNREEETICCRRHHSKH